MRQEDKEALLTELEEIDNIDDESESEDSGIVQYNISTYGADLDVEGIVRRLRKQEIFIPEFQRNFVWKLPEASRFIESLLLGLPVPGIFLARDPRTNRLLVIDGQQRLKTLLFFYDGHFNPTASDGTQRIFKLTKIESQFEGKTYNTLKDPDRFILDNAIIHASIVKQDFPQDNNSSIYHIFERLNNGGRILTPQEIRCAVYHGKLIGFIHNLNQSEHWRRIYGRKNTRLKDEELILRFFALYYGHSEYKKPMKEFLNTFAEKFKDLQPEEEGVFRKLFTETLKTVYNSIGERAFRIENALNAAIFDSVAIGIAKRIEKGPISNETDLREAYHRLLKDKDYLDAVSQSTASENLVRQRIASSISAFEILQ